MAGVAASACPFASADPLHVLRAVQITRFNDLNTVRERKLKAGEPVPELVSEQLKKGDLKLPWTTLSKE